MSKIFLIFFMSAFILCGCGNKESYEPTKYNSQAGLEKLTQDAANKESQTLKKDNFVFSGSRDLGGKAAAVKELDAFLRPVLKKLFGDARLVWESTTPETKIDKEVVENKFTYVVKKFLVPKDGESLHAALISEGFHTSPRLGRKPTIWSGGAAMSLFVSKYSFVISIDTRKQEIVVESYRLGSKYDRM